YFVRDSVVTFESRVIVGREYTRTPVFSAALRHIDLNPTWTVPPGIVGEVLAAARRDAGYLSRQGIEVLDAAGRAVSVDVSRYSAATFPYTFRQRPGPLNPLGQVKFVLPNAYNVYLHDTPARSLFASEQRTFSHGCIRVSNPLDLAALVLDTPRWSVEALRAAIATGATRTIPLARPVPVLILYWTASADLHGELHFYADVYDRDPALLRALNTR
ncbi:MAG TPA: L,D-transpeptidase family protein, partial [Longimicrobiales bacterium]|nr:L,D-transpeptidase family protein [Longimicrobiales bacterium]